MKHHHCRRPAAILLLALILTGCGDSKLPEPQRSPVPGRAATPPAGSNSAAASPSPRQRIVGIWQPVHGNNGSTMEFVADGILRFRGSDPQAKGPENTDGTWTLRDDGRLQMTVRFEGTSQSKSGWVVFEGDDRLKLTDDTGGVLLLERAK